MQKSHSKGYIGIELLYMFGCPQRTSEQDAIKQHVREIKNLLRQNHEKIREIYSEEGAKNACRAEFDEMVKRLTDEMSRGFLPRVSTRLLVTFFSFNIPHWKHLFVLMKFRFYF